MALVREIVECLLNPASGSIRTEWDNYAEAIRRPKVEDGDFLRFTPGSYDSSAARFVYIVKGVRFVRSRDDPMWYLKEEDDLVGVLSAAHSVWLHDLGYVVGVDADRDECRNVVMRAVSDLLNQHKNGRISRLFANQYKDFSFCKCDFECIRDELKNFGHAGFVGVEGRWKGIPHEAVTDNPELASPSVCALGLLESFDMGMAMSHAYVDLPQTDYDTILAVLRDCDAKDAEQMLSAAVRKTDDKDSVHLLLSSEKISSLRTLIMRSPHESRSEASRVLDTVADVEMRRWKHRCRRELNDLRIRILLNDPILGVFR